MQFASPYLLALAILLPLFVLWQIRGERGSNPVRLSSVSALRTIRPDWRIRLRWLPTGLRLLAILLLIIGLARPQKGNADASIPGEGIDIVLALDISRSMVDSRIDGTPKSEIAKQAVTDFIRGRENDRIGMVVFQREAFALSPLTLDYQALLRLVDQVQNGLLPEGTGIGMGIAESINLLRDSRAQSRTIVLLTDGENNELLVPPLQAARLAEALNIRVYTIGFLGGTFSGASGQSARRIEESLTEIANITNAKYYAATDEESLDAIYEEIGQLEKSRVERDRFMTFDELLAYFALPALGLLVVEVILRGTVFRRMP